MNKEIIYKEKENRMSKKVEVEFKQQAQYIVDYLENKEEKNIFEKRTRENIAKDFFKDLDEAINHPL